MNKITDYIHHYIQSANPVLQRLEKEEKKRRDIRPSIGPDAGRFLSLMIRSKNMTRVLEMGTSLGYSAIWMAEALAETGGRLISIEKDPRLCAEAAKSMEEAGISETVTLLQGDAGTILKEMNGPFDMILQDSDKFLYVDLLDTCIELIRPGGLIVVDDTLFKPMGIPDTFSEPVHRYVETAFSDPRLYSTLLPVGDGLLVSVKI